MEDDFKKRQVDVRWMPKNYTYMKICQGLQFAQDYLDQQDIGMEKQAKAHCLYAVLCDRSVGTKIIDKE